MISTFDTLPQLVQQILNDVTYIKEALLKSNTSDKNIPEELLSINEVATILKLSKPTIYGYTSKGILPCMKMGKRLYFLNTDIINYVKTKRKKTLEEINVETDKYLKRNKTNSL